MSIRVMASVWDSMIEDRLELLVLLALADFANDEGVSWPCLDRLASKARCSRRGLQNVLNRLEESGVLEVDRKGGGPPGSANTYKIVFKERGAPGAPLPLGRGAKLSTGGVHPATGRGAKSEKEGCTGCANDPSVLIRHRSVSIEPSGGDVLALNGEVSQKKTEKTPEEIIYDAYPLKVGKAGALFKIRAALTKIDFQKLLGLTLRYAAAVKQFGDLKYTPHPSTWFHQERFFDDPSTWVRATIGTPKAASAQEIAKSWGVEC
jgi:hypothetical protein